MLLLARSGRSRLLHPLYPPPAVAAGRCIDTVMRVANRRKTMIAAPLLRSRTSFLMAGAAILLCVLTASPASAQDAGPTGEDADQIVLTGRLVVSADETVDTAVILDGPALVEGTVREALVVL